MRILLVAGSPEPSSTELVAKLATSVDEVIAVDRGAEICRAACIVPQAFCGDADTVSAETLVWIKEHAGEVELYESAKDDTDLSLAFDCAREHAAAIHKDLELAVTCASAGRMDHALAVFGVLAKNADLAPVLIEDTFECQILSPKGCPVWEFTESEQGRGFSFVALSDGSQVSLDGMRWELDHKRIDALRDLGISNVIDSDYASIEVHKGIVAAFLLN